MDNIRHLIPKVLETLWKGVLFDPTEKKINAKMRLNILGILAESLVPQLLVTQKQYFSDKTNT